MRCRTLPVAAAVLVLSACENINGFQAVTGPEAPPSAVLTGRWVGTIASEVSPFPAVSAEMLLTQAAGQLTGEMIINQARGAMINAVLSGTRLTGSWTYTDLCGGSATFTAEVRQGSRITGTFSSVDCIGTTTGGFTLDRSAP